MSLKLKKNKYYAEQEGSSGFSVDNSVVENSIVIAVATVGS